MQQQPDTKINPSARLTESPYHETVKASSPWSVTKVEVLPDFRLRVRFYDGVTGLVHMASLVQSPDAGVFASLRDISLFEQVYVSCGAVTWPGESPDLAPDAMHKAIMESGEWTP